MVIPRYYTVLAIGETRDPYFTPTLAKLLESEDDDSVKAAAIEALAKIGGPEASDLLSRRWPSPWATSNRKRPRPSGT